MGPAFRLGRTIGRDDKIIKAANPVSLVREYYGRDMKKIKIFFRITKHYPMR